MHIHLRAGPVDLPMASVASLYPALKSVLKTVDGRFLGAVDTTIPTIQDNDGSANVLHDVLGLHDLIGSRDHLRRVKRQCEEVTQSVEAETAVAKNIVAAADNYVILLRSIAAHIRTGTKIKNEASDPPLAEAGRVLRQAFLLGDPDGLAAKTANSLDIECDEATEKLLNAVAGINRIASALHAATLGNQKRVFADLHKAASNPHAVINDQSKTAIRIHSDAETKYADSYRSSYADMYLKNRHTPSVPVLACLRYGTVTRVDAGWRFTRGAAA